MKIHIIGVDFTSSPKAKKPIVCLHGMLEGAVLTIDEKPEEYKNFKSSKDSKGFEELLKSDGPWIAGMDFPFGQSRRFIKNIGWPQCWQGYVHYVGSLSREEFRQKLDAYREPRYPNDKEHLRKTDKAAGSSSGPQKLYGTPIGLMFFEGAPLLLRSSVLLPQHRDEDAQLALSPSLPQHRDGDAQPERRSEQEKRIVEQEKRIVVEAYPALVFKNMLGNANNYKNPKKQEKQGEYKKKRLKLFDALKDDKFFQCYGFKIHASRKLCDDPEGDHLDALLAAIQAAWAWKQRTSRFGAPKNVDTLEGWIADPYCLRE